MSAFFYGSLMSKRVLLRVLCGKSATKEDEALKLKAITLKPCILKEYKRSCVKGEDYPAIIFTGNAQDHVTGICCEGLTEKDIELLDTFEGDEYERIKVQVQLLDGTIMSSNAYLWARELDTLTGTEWSFEEFIQSGREQKWLDSRCEFYQVDQLHEIPIKVVE